MFRSIRRFGNAAVSSRSSRPLVCSFIELLFAPPLVSLRFRRIFFHPQIRWKFAVSKCFLLPSSPLEPNARVFETLGEKAWQTGSPRVPRIQIEPDLDLGNPKDYLRFQLRG